MQDPLAPKDFTVLLVEDEATTREQLARMIATRGYRLIIAENGQQGLDIFRNNPVDLVLSDVMMPFMNGLSMAREIRREAPTAQIIILTAFNDTEHLLDAIEIGINQFLFKPLQTEKLFAVLERCCETVQMHRLLDRQHEQIRMLSNALEQSPSISIITGTDGTIEYVNRKFCEITGYAAEEVIGCTPRIIQSGQTADTTYEMLWDSILNGEEWRGTLRNRRKNGEFYWENCSISPLFTPDGTIAKFIKTAEDITERRKLESAAQRTRHLEALSILAGGMAHDFNNLLQVILGSIALAKSRTEQGSGLHDLLDMAERSSGEARTLSRRLLELVRESEPVSYPVAVAPLILSGIESVLNGTGITCELDLPANLPMVNGDEHQLRQVICQLVRNAMEAMPGGGTIRIAAHRQVLEQFGHPPMKAGNYIHIIFSDTGTGIAPDKLERIFEPYFSTKEMGSRKGQGLGLAICHSVIDKHGGSITAESEKGHGATFHIWLPIVAAQ
ncbi:response regulator [Geobacter sp. SVR]|uniref:ATP-binding response regulator n=1 Tax=Geobacter sp. SVR TaxID=2495594 RepID=UPI00143EFFB7|nr:response regulator [Geobacter sp. SVR]BCS55125.1 hypothetical protein GSVR_34330 [Geobacter sp. SVR]GCF85306.1 hypothetical protein GSbR_19060 [Geobacter sp. SVR]